MKYEIISRKRVYDGFLKIEKVNIKHDTFNTTTALEKSVEVLEKGDSCAALIFEKDTQSLLFINQFRMPTAAKDNGWIIELVAGTIEENEEPTVTMRREIEEEIGYNINSLEPVALFYVSPGWTSERIFLFYAETNSTEKTLAGGGKADEKEDIQLVKIPINELKDELKNITDAKTHIGIQWFLLNKMKENAVVDSRIIMKTP